ncbi:MAG TPA: hypothetical protein VNG71_00710 [Pyrinomonadaceae bacterium]|nr:hypothetical protein [Pyrinomonadaceae bacterium]
MFVPLISNIKTVVLIGLAALCLTTAASAQPTTCSVKLDQIKDTPELFGLRLGMTYDQVKERLPLVQFGRADEIGLVRTSFNPHFDPRVDPKAFEAVRTISLDFLDGKLVTLWIGFEETYKWPKLDEFVNGFATALSLPSQWPVRRTAREIMCDHFSVQASIIAGGPSIRITDEQAQNTIGERREAAVAAAEAQVIGDLRSKTYYPSDCPAKEDVPAVSRVVFKNKEVAEENGYKLAKDCQ